MKIINLHRFQDAIALSVGNGETNYITPDLAEKLSALLADYAKDVREHPFCDSPLGTQSLEIDDKTLKIKLDRTSAPGPGF